MTNQEGKSLEDGLSKLKRNVERTRDIRFHASKRLLARQDASSYAVSTLSAIVILTSLVPNFVTLTDQQNQIILSISIVLSVVIIFTSLIYSSQNYMHRSRILHDCAIKLSRIYNEIILAESIGKVNDIFLTEIFSKYQEALENCPENHDSCDMYLERASKVDLFPSYYKDNFINIKKLWNYFLWATLSNLWLLLPALSILISIIVVVLWVFGTPPQHM